MFIVTTLIACILAALFIHLSFGVIRLRRHHKVGLGNGGVDDLERAIRAQANFAEYVPIALILMACLELNGAPLWLIAILGIALVAGKKRVPRPATGITALLTWKRGLDM